jgi:hypothetical protein
MSRPRLPRTRDVAEPDRRADAPGVPADHVHRGTSKNVPAAGAPPETRWSGRA